MKKNDATFLEQSYLKPALYVYDYKVLDKVDTGIMEIFKTSIIVQEKIWQTIPYHLPYFCVSADLSAHG